MITSEHIRPLLSIWDHTADFHSLLQRWGAKTVNLSRLIATQGPITPPALAIDQYASICLANKNVVQGDKCQDQDIVKLTDSIKQLTKSLTLTFPALLRSSLSVEGGDLSSWSGIATSVVVENIDELPNAAAIVLSSLLSDTARQYRIDLAQHGILSDQLHLALLLQTYVKPQWSGVALTNGRGSSQGAFIVDIVEGGNQGITSGRGASLQLVLDKSCGVIISSFGLLDSTEALLDMVLERLFDTCIEAEILFGSPQCVEWGFDNEGRLLIFQVQKYTNGDL